MKTVIGLFDYASDAYATKGDLIGSGLDQNSVSVVTSLSNRDYTPPPADPELSETAEGASTGATAGAIAGGTAGLLASLGLLAVPGIGPLLAAGPIVAILAGIGIGAMAGGLIGGLIGLGIPEHEAEIYAEGVNRGGTLVTVDAADSDADRVAAVMSQHHAVDIDKRAAEWETAGWQRKYARIPPSPAHINPPPAAIAPQTRGIDRHSPTDTRPTSLARIYAPK